MDASKLLSQLASATALLVSSCGGTPDPGGGPVVTPSGSTSGTVSPQTNELIVLAAPRGDDPYYGGVEEAIVSFHLSYARAIIDAGDDVLVLTDANWEQRYVDALGPERVLASSQEDIWLRDFGTANPAGPLMFRYTAAGQGGGPAAQYEADLVQDTLAQLARDGGLAFAESGLLNYGGNFVDDYDGRAVVSTKFLADDALSEAADLEHVAFIEADGQGGLEHAEGVVAFVEPNVLVVNAYPDDPGYAAQLQADLKGQLPGVSNHTIVAPYDPSQVYDPRFGSACGLYTNMLVTPERIYLPQFGVPEDSIALETVRGLTSKQVVPVRSSGVCTMGGGVRCLSWQLRGENARRLRAYAEGGG